MNAILTSRRLSFGFLLLLAVAVSAAGFLGWIFYGADMILTLAANGLSNCF
ncbi:hypothetical protein [Rhizobium paknamense]|uniref:Uncharacterized protein n=1 Tax=Rhizobium paknamense TaxID=1206817 RepID=A0ABU0I996_9HYPH|nr:hypothetical protein [Rhizobium paknamense]MDQ0454818.1 hypothetical protein [Rhizobium paknamense]